MKLNALHDAVSCRATRYAAFVAFTQGQMRKRTGVVDGVAKSLSVRRADSESVNASEARAYEINFGRAIRTLCDATAQSQQQLQNSGTE